ncbi:MAG TPA: CsgG/HfaB family protein [Candidatus Cloacimonadota bacterium]|nr:CsgG/HfaB family protein [Candidatus Cloacimonadota bacterium]
MKQSPNRAWSIALMLMVLVSACSQNKQVQKRADASLEKGDYYQASILAAEALKMKPSNSKAQAILKEAYPKASMESGEKLAGLKLRDSGDKWAEILKEYESLQRLGDAISSLPPITDSETGERIRFDLRDYAGEINEAKEQAADYNYRQGVHFSMLSSEAATQRQAAGYFKAALSFIPNYKDSALRYEEARQKAIRRIAILPFEDKSGSKDRYGAITDIFADQIIGAIMQNKAQTEFMELITRDQINKVISEQQLSSSGLMDEASTARLGMLLGAHEILSGRILQIDYSAPRTVHVDLQESANITVEREEGEEEEMEVQCVYRKYTKRSSVTVMASYSVVDVATGKINTQQSFSASQNFSEDWGTIISGDRRALNPQQKKLVSTAEPMAPSEKDMVNSAIREISEDIVSHFCRYLR